jgi:hypothetical protein
MTGTESRPCPNLGAENPCITSLSDLYSMIGSRSGSSQGVRSESGCAHEEREVARRRAAFDPLLTWVAVLRARCYQNVLW